AGDSPAGARVVDDSPWPPAHNTRFLWNDHRPPASSACWAAATELALLPPERNLIGSLACAAPLPVELVGTDHASSIRSSRAAFVVPNGETEGSIYLFLAGDGKRAQIVLKCGSAPGADNVASGRC